MNSQSQEIPCKKTHYHVEFCFGGSPAVMPSKWINSHNVICSFTKSGDKNPSRIMDSHDSSDDDGIFNTMLADTLDPKVARASDGMVLAV